MHTQVETENVFVEEDHNQQLFQPDPVPATIPPAQTKLLALRYIVFDVFNACSPALNFILSQCLPSSNDSLTREGVTSLNLFCVDICMVYTIYWRMEWKYLLTKNRELVEES